MTKKSQFSLDCLPHGSVFVPLNRLLLKDVRKLTCNEFKEKSDAERDEWEKTHGLAVLQGQFLTPQMISLAPAIVGVIGAVL